MTHGHSQSPKGSAYGMENMLQRCNNPKKHWLYGVSVGAEYQFVHVGYLFENFIEDMGLPPLRPITLLIALTTMATMSRGIADGQLAASRHQILAGAYTVQLNGEVLNIAQLALKKQG